MATARTTGTQQAAIASTDPLALLPHNGIICLCLDAVTSAPPIYEAAAANVLALGVPKAQ